MYYYIKRMVMMTLQDSGYQWQLGTPSWQIDGETVETVADFIFGGSKITEDGDCSHEIIDAYSLEGKLWPT